MTFWLVLSLMTAAAVFAVLWPLSRPSARGSGSDIAVYRDQLAEIDRDLSAGLIGTREAEAARLEVSRRLLAAANAQPAAEEDRKRPSALWRRRIAAVVALAGVPTIGVGLYLTTGSPNMPGAPLALRQDAPIEQRPIESIVLQVEQHLEKNPNDGRGWEVLAPVYMRLGRFEDAVKARRNALRLLGSTPAREADLGEALTGAANGIVTADAKSAFERAFSADSDNVKAQYFLALAADQDGKTDEAVRLWRALLARTPRDAPYRPLIESSLARVDPGSRPPGPSADDVAAAENLTPEQRQEFVRGMVERLATRLKGDGSDVDGWLRLIRAHMVLGERENAQSALREARAAIGDDPDKRKRLDEGIKLLGIGG